MKKILFALTITTLLYSCQSAEYSFRMIRPVLSETLHYENDTMELVLAAPKVHVDAMSFTLTNKLGSPLKILWDDFSMAINGETDRVLHKNSRYIDKNSLQPNTTIAAGAHIVEKIFPTADAKLITDRKGETRVILEPFLPQKYNRGKELHNSKILIHLAYEIENKKFYKDVELLVKVTS